MRNLLEYPITLDEIINTLEMLKEKQLIEDDKKEVVGDTTAYILQMTIYRIRRMKELGIDVI